MGGIGALAAGAIGRANPVQAATGDPITVDGTFTGSGTTQLTTSGIAAFKGISSDPGGNALWGQATASTGGAWGVLGQTSSTGGAGVVGIAEASSGATLGAYGFAASPSGVGV